MSIEQKLEDVFFGEIVEGLAYNAFGFTVKVAGKTISNLTLEEAEEILRIPLPIVTITEKGGMYFPIVRMGVREYTCSGYRTWRDANNRAVSMADDIFQQQIDKVLGV